MMLEGVLGNQPSADQMFLNDALQHGWVTPTIPCPLRIDDRDRSPFADPKAVRLGPKHTALLAQTELLQTSLQKLPRREALLFVAALRRGLIATEEDMATGGWDANRGGDLVLRRGHARHTTRPSRSLAGSRSADGGCHCPSETLL